MDSLVMKMISITISVIIFLVNWYFLRKLINISNSIYKELYIDTGKMVILENRNKFTYYGKQYARISVGIDGKKEKRFALNTNFMQCDGELISNIKLKRDFCDLMLGRYNKDNLYRKEGSIENDILYSSMYGIFCSIEEKDKVESYYNNDENYEWKISKYIEDEKWDTYDINLDKKYIKELYKLFKAEKGKDLECSNITNECMIEKVSNDNFLMFEIRLLRNNEHWYCDINNLYEGDDNLLEGCVYVVDACKVSKRLGNYIDEVLSNKISM